MFQDIKTAISKAITPLLWRVIAFLGIFILFSGVAGPKIIGDPTLLRDHFLAYGSLGKALIFGIVAFILLVRHQKNKTVRLQAWQPLQLGWIVLSCVVFGGTLLAIDKLLDGSRDAVLIAATHTGLIASVTLAGLGCVGLANVKLLWQQFKQSIITSVGIAALFYLFLYAVYALWQPLAGVVMWSVHALLSLSGLQATVMPPNTLLFDKFGITIAEYCSGIESIALFTGLYVIVGLLDWPKLHKKRYFLVFPVALLALGVLNILRVYGLIMAGYYINQDIAFSLFHTYAGLVFFILYSAIFWSIAYKFMIQKKDDSRTHDAAKKQSSTT